jgi:hypothetical protein
MLRHRSIKISWRLPRGFYFSTGLAEDLAMSTQASMHCANSTDHANEVMVVKSGGWLGHLEIIC